MSQSSVVEFLKKNKDKWFDVYEISKRLKISYTSVSHNLLRLKRGNLVDFRIESREGCANERFYYKYKLW